MQLLLLRAGVVPGDPSRVREADRTLKWGLKSTEEEGSSFPAAAALGRVAVSFPRQQHREEQPGLTISAGGSPGPRLGGLHVVALTWANGMGPYLYFPQCSAHSRCSGYDSEPSELAVICQ